MCDPTQKFSMSYLAANLSQEINGVSKLHGQVSRTILNPLWPGYLPWNHMGHVTNGVHYATWTANEWKAIRDRSAGPDELAADDARDLKVRNILRSKLIDRLVESLSGTKMFRNFIRQKKS